MVRVGREDNGVFNYNGPLTVLSALVRFLGRYDEGRFANPVVFNVCFRRLQFRCPVLRGLEEWFRGVAQCAKCNVGICVFGRVIRYVAGFVRWDANLVNAGRNELSQEELNGIARGHGCQHRAFVIAVNLEAVDSTPYTSPLAVAERGIRVRRAGVNSIFVFALGDLYLFVQFQGIFGFNRDGTVGSIDCVRDAFARVVRFGVEARFVLIWARLNFLHFLGVVTPVPSFKNGTDTFLLCFVLGVERFLLNFHRYEDPSLVRWAVCVFLILYRTIFRGREDVVNVSRRFNFLRARDGRFFRSFVVVNLVTVITTVSMSFGSFLAWLTVVYVLRRKRCAQVIRDRGPLLFRAYPFDHFNYKYRGAFKWSNRVFLLVGRRLGDINFFRRVLSGDRLRRQGLAVRLARLHLVREVGVNASAGGLLMDFFRWLVLLLVRSRFLPAFVGFFRANGGDQVRVGVIPVYQGRQDGLFVGNLRFVIHIAAIRAAGRDARLVWRLSALVRYDSNVVRVKGQALVSGDVCFFFLFFRSFRRDFFMVLCFGRIRQ